MWFQGLIVRVVLVRCILRLAVVQSMTSTSVFVTRTDVTVESPASDTSHDTINWSSLCETDHTNIWSHYLQFLFGLLPRNGRFRGVYPPYNHGAPPNLTSTLPSFPFTRLRHPTPANNFWTFYTHFMQFYACFQ